MLSPKITPASRFLVIGGTGLIGGELCQRWLSKGRDVVATTRQTLDLSHDLAGWNPPTGGGVAVICAAIADQEKCRREPEWTRRINVTQTKILAHRLADFGYFVVFLSTNLVFDGANPFPSPEIPVCPATEYGRQKAACEQGLLPLGENYAVVRLTKVVHDALPLFTLWREALSRGEVIHPFRNYICSPISLRFAVSGISAIAEGQAAGVWHLSARDELPYSAIARLLAAQNGYADALVAPDDAPPGLLEHLPPHACLDATATENAFAFKMPWARDALAGFEFANNAEPVKP